VRLASGLAYPSFQIPDSAEVSRKADARHTDIEPQNHKRTDAETIAEQIGQEVEAQAGA